MTRTAFGKTLLPLAAMAFAGFAAGPLTAQGYDVSGVEVDPDLAARVPADIREAGVLVGGSDNAFAPWEYLAGDDGQTPEGIDIDLANAMAALMDLTYESRTASFASILPALGTTYDVGISAFSITKERLETVNFVNYVTAGSEWAVRPGNPDGFDPANICGATIAVQTGSYYENIIIEASETCETEGNEAIDILPFGVQTEAMTRVATGGADAAIAGGATVMFAAEQSGGAVEPMRPVGMLGETGPVGIAVPKDDMELTQLIADCDEHVDRKRHLSGHPGSLGRRRDGCRSGDHQPRSRAAKMAVTGQTETGQGHHNDASGRTRAGVTLNEVVPPRHIGRWIAAAILLLIAGQVIVAIATNPNFRWDTFWLGFCSIRSSFAASCGR